MNGKDVMGECRWCGQKDEGNAGDYYHEKACHRRDVIRRMEELEAAGDFNSQKMERLERELFLASYTGD